MQALYRQYRPKTFSEVIGQDHVVKTLKNQLKRASTAHAYVFVGTRGVGKTSVARLLATGVNCLSLKEDGELCGQCDSCTLITNGQFPDIIEIDAASHTGVDNVRSAIIEAVRFAPMQGTKKVFIIDEVHMLSGSAFNALLKTLEEPPAHALFILATTEYKKVPATVASRCQRFFFQPISQILIAQTLQYIAQKEGREIDEEALQAIARTANGSMRDAERTLEQVFGSTDALITIEHVQQIIPVPSAHIVCSLLLHAFEKNTDALETAMQEMMNKGISTRLLHEELIELVRVLLLAKHGAKQIAGLWSEKPQWSMLLAKSDKQYLLDLMKILMTDSVRLVDIGVPYLGIQVALLSVMHESHVPDISIPKTEEQIVPIIETIVQKEPIVTSEIIQELKDKWKRCCEHVSKQSVSLPLVLNEAEPLSIEENTIKIVFFRPFHFETISQPRNLTLLAEAIKEIMQKDYIIQPILQVKEDEKKVSDIANMFGGSVIEN